jgi:hypothetical protein
LLTSTLLTLIVVPVVCAYLDEAGAWLKRRRTGVRPFTHHSNAPLGVETMS